MDPLENETSSETGIQSGPTPLPIHKETPPRRPIPRPAFPLVSLLILLLGLLFLLLVISAGFNVWYILGPEMRRDAMNRVDQMEMEARMQQDKAMQAADMARLAEIQARDQTEKLRQENEELKRQLELLREQVKDAK